jgi:hypothetical protein
VVAYSHLRRAGSLMGSDASAAVPRRYSCSLLGWER